MMKSNLRSQMWRLAAVLLWVCGAMACAGNNPKPSSPFGDVAPPPNAQQALATMAPWLPEDTMAVAIVDVPFMVNMYRTSGIIPKEWDDTALRRDLGDFSKKRLGIDITKARWAAFAFSATPTSTGDEFAALFFEGDFGEPATLEERSFGSLKAYRVGEDDLGLIK
ncbi:MAG: hypothetical protein AAFS10_17355, partial [Myxococcota bacterium]